MAITNHHHLGTEKASRLASGELAGIWNLVLPRGAGAIVFGLLTIIPPDMTLPMLVVIFGVFALIDGGLSSLAAARVTIAGARWLLATVGLVGCIAGTTALFSPGMSSFALLELIGCWATAVGALEIFAAVRMRTDNEEEEWALLVAGGLSAALGLILVVQSDVGSIRLLHVIAIYAVGHGILMLLFSKRLRRQQRFPVREPIND